MTGKATLDKIRARVIELARLEHDHDGRGGFSMRPDSYGLAMDATAPRNPPLFDVGTADATVFLRGTGTIVIRFCPLAASGKALQLDIVDGSTILYAKDLPAGGRVHGTIKRPLGGEDEAREEIGLLFAWLNGEAR